MQVTLLNYTPLNICSHAIRTCWQSFEKGDNGGEKDVELIERVGNKFKHASTLEHLYYNFYIQGISRALLQELARHRVASLSVKSTRYTLKELKKEAKFELGDFDRAARFIVLTGDERVPLGRSPQLQAGYPLKSPLPDPAVPVWQAQIQALEQSLPPHAPGAGRPPGC